MSKSVRLLDFPEGELGEIVDLEDSDIFEHYGAHVGMSIVILHKAMEFLVQIGYNQIHLGQEQLKKILVKPVSL